MTLGEFWDMIPQAVGGSSSTYYADGAWASTNGELLRVGGRATVGSQCGVASSRSGDGFSFSSADIGARLAFYGTPILVDGSVLVAM